MGLRFVSARSLHDCGLIINPGALRGTIEANPVQSLSRGLMEEVSFDRTSVTSVHWKTYTVARAELRVPKSPSSAPQIL